MSATQRMGRREFVPLLVLALTLTAVHCTRPTVTYKVIDLGGGPTEIGVVAGAYALLPLLTAIPIGSSIDKRGDHRYFMGGIMLVVAAPITAVAAGSIAVVSASIMMLGMGHLAIAVATQSRASKGSALSRDRQFAHVAVATSVGQLAGSALVGVMVRSGPDPDRTSPAFWAAAVAATLAAIGIAWMVTRRNAPSCESGADLTVATERPRLGLDTLTGLLRRKGMASALTTGIIVTATIDLIIAYLPLIGEERGIAPSIVGVMLGLRAAAALASRLALPGLLRTFSRARVLASCLAAASVALFGVAALSWIPLLMLLMFIAGFGLGVGTPMTGAWVAGRAPAAQRGVAVSMKIASNRLSQLLMPIGLGVLANIAGPIVIFLVGGGGLLAGALMVRAIGMDDD